MTISQAARAAGVGVETVRFYERRKLIMRPSKPPDGGFRRYPPETIERIRFIRQAQGLGFSLREIEELLSLRADPASDCGQVRERAVAKLGDVQRKIGELQRFRRALEELIAACPGRGALRACSIIEALAAASHPQKAATEGGMRYGLRDSAQALRRLYGPDREPFEPEAAVRGARRFGWRAS